jgi:moderate conductance mechanosensitive channel
MPDFGAPPWSTWLQDFGGTFGPILLIVVLTLLAMRATRLLVHGVIKAVFDREAAHGSARELSATEVAKRRDTIERLGARVIQGFVVVVAALTILAKLDYNIGPAVAGFGVVGIAVGFGAQSLVRDYFNGALILLENQYSIGDVVSIAGVTGNVEDLTLRRTTLRDFDGVVHTVPNGEIKVASNRTRTWARINQDVTVSYGTDIDRAIEVVSAVGREMAEDPAWKGKVLEPPRVERVEALAEYGITLKILGTVQAVDQWAAAGELRKRLLAAFTREGIEIPRPQRVVLARDPDGPGPRPPEVVVGPPPGQDALPPDG